MDSIEDGHEHLCIFEFENGIPEILIGLHIAKAKFSNVPKESKRLGICQSKDFDEIRKRTEYTLGLKEKYGTEWWRYDDEA
ncbi:hypothetical protein M601_005745 [Cellulophaga baltica 4]|nr:hypothetical protein M601_005745 [Cellulophaga baltica 4]